MTGLTQRLHVVCNWNDRGREIIEQLRADILQRAGEYPPIVVLSDQAIDDSWRRSSENGRMRFVEFIKGDPCDPKELERVGAANASSIIVLADDYQGDYADSKTLMVLFALVRCFEENLKTTLPVSAAGFGRGSALQDPPQGLSVIPSIVAEITGKLAEGARLGEPTKTSRELELIRRKLGCGLEVLYTEKIRSRVFAQNARTGQGGLGQAYDSLLSFDEKNCELYLTTVRTSREWTLFSDVVSDFIRATGAGGFPMLPVGIVGKDGFGANPWGALPDGPSLDILLMAYGPPPPDFNLESGRASPLETTRGAADTRADSSIEQRREDGTMRTDGSGSVSPQWLMSGHYIVCHWNDRAPEIISELRRHEELVREAVSGEHRVPVIVLTRKTVEASMLDKIGSEAGCETLRGAATMDVYFRPADPTIPEALRQVNASHAKSIVVLADDAAGNQSDSRSLQCLLAIKYAIEQARENEKESSAAIDPYVVVEVVDQSNLSKFKTLQSAFGGKLEIIRGESLRTRILAHAARTPGLVDFYQDLLTHEENSNEFYPLAAKPFIDQIGGGRTAIPFPELAVAVLDHYSAKSAERRAAIGAEYSGNGEEAVSIPLDELIPVGVWRDQNVFLNPKPDSDAYDVRPTDSLLVIAYHPPELPDAELAAKSVAERTDSVHVGAVEEPAVPPEALLGHEPKAGLDH